MLLQGLRPPTFMPMTHRLGFAVRYAPRYLLLSLGVALVSDAVVFGLWSAGSYRQMLDVRK